MEGSLTPSFRASVTSLINSRMHLEGVDSTSWWILLTHIPCLRYHCNRGVAINIFFWHELLRREPYGVFHKIRFFSRGPACDPLLLRTGYRLYKRSGPFLGNMHGVHWCSRSLQANDLVWICLLSPSRIKSHQQLLLGFDPHSLVLWICYKIWGKTRWFFFAGRHTVVSAGFINIPKFHSHYVPLGVETALCPLFSGNWLIWFYTTFHF